MNIKLLIFLPVIFLGMALGAKGQAPQQFNYQGALRNADGSPVANKSIMLRLSILNGSESGAVQYAETRQVVTSALGLYNVAIGSTGTLGTSGTFSAINWGSGLKYLKVDVDPDGGSNFVSAGASQLLSVPYALYAANAGGAGTNGADGKSAYQIWLDAGNTGTQADFLNAIKGAAGSAGAAGVAGANGKSAYQIWLDAGNTGTQADFLSAIKGAVGAAGVAGADGKSAYQIWLDAGNTGTQANFLNAIKGAIGATGADGKSVYQVWLDAGNTGTEADFLNSMKMDPNAAGDLSGIYPAPKVIKIQGVTISSVAPTANQILKFDGTSWVPSTVPSAVAEDVITASTDVIALSNNTGAALKPMTIDIKAATTANSFLMTDANKVVKWQSATDAKLVSGTLSNISFSTLLDGTSTIAANQVALLKLTVPGASIGDPVFLTNIGDETEYSILATWVSAANEVSVRLANYQPIPVNISGRTHKILLMQVNNN